MANGFKRNANALNIFIHFILFMPLHLFGKLMFT